MTWVAPEPEPVDGPLTGEDRPILEGYLGWERRTLLNICAGLDGEQLASRPVVSSTLSLLGLIRHLAKVERIWFRHRVAGERLAPMYDAALGRDADFEDLNAEAAPVDYARLVEEWRHADAAAARFAFDHTIDVEGDQFSLRMVYVHMIGEYSRHNGHADLLREAIDGSIGR